MLIICRCLSLNTHISQMTSYSCTIITFVNTCIIFGRMA
ncbi:hypothetical protein Taro_019724 [Colocasia esculenta]|uniref:Uncharacterized protein n=1 Tax=Colocasia esculenta TaxID=4460 RepID=A0A843V068_COLES|nr:hypothetical protein [Colocasia esculenta]